MCCWIFRSTTNKNLGWIRYTAAACYRLAHRHRKIFPPWQVLRARRCFFGYSSNVLWKIYIWGFSSSYVHNFAAKFYYSTSAAFVQMNINYNNGKHSFGTTKAQKSFCSATPDIFDIQASSILIITRSISCHITKKNQWISIILFANFYQFLVIKKKKTITAYMEYLV